jgi:hypothetical protein
VRPGTRGKLPARRLAPLQCAGHFAEGEIEHVVQEERCAFERRQPIERQQQRHRQVLGQLGAAVGRERRCVHDWLRQPRADILLVAGASRRQHVETDSRRRCHQKSP